MAMKKYFYLAIVAIATIACNEGFNEPEEINTEDITIGETIFTGRLASTKTSLGEKEGSSYKILWEDGDELSIADAESGAVLGTATLTSGIGENDGVFSFPGNIANGTEVTLTYEGSAIKAEQSKASSNRSFKGAASATATVNDGAADFTMVQTSAVIRVNVASTALAGATLNAVIFRSESADLNVDGGDYVRVALTDTPELNSTAQEIVFAVKAADLSGQEIDIAFELTKDGENYTIPVGFKGKQLATGSVNSFNFSNLSNTQCVPWYEPHDTRLMAGAGYAYGEANCYFIQCKNGTYTGATYVNNPVIQSIVNIDYRARGDFRYVSNPTGVSFTWMKLGNTNESTATGTGAIYTMRVSAANGSDPTAFSFNPNPDDYSITVTNDNAYAGAPVLLMVKDKKILWGWAFWNIAADGTQLVKIPIKKGSSTKILNMDIGQATSNLDLWAQSLGTSPTTNDPIGRTIFRYQWGRFLPMFFNTYNSLDVNGGQRGNVPAIVGPLSMKESLEHPCGLIVASATTSASINDWLTETDNTLWGNTSTDDANTIGTKTIYDPCPKGYRVCDRYTFSVLRYNNTWTRSGVGNNNVTAPDTYGHCYYIANISETETAVFPFSGYFTEKTVVSTNNNVVMAGGMGTNYGIWWSNFGNNDYCLYLSSQNADSPAVSELKTAANPKARAVSVRCQVDEYNR